MTVDGSYESWMITAKLNLKKLAAESREVAQAFNEFSDDLEQIEKKYTDPNENEVSDEDGIQLPKTGYWINENPRDLPGVYKCSVCGKYGLEYGGRIRKSNYCPTCGAVMDSEG